jgi:hypothetical protein
MFQLDVFKRPGIFAISISDLRSTDKSGAGSKDGAAKPPAFLSGHRSGWHQGLPKWKEAYSSFRSKKEEKMSAHPPQVVRPFQKLFVSLFILTFFFFSVSTFAEPAWALGVRASFQGGFLHLEWDAAPAGATDWRVQVYSPNSDLFNGNLLICGPGVVGIGPCPFGIGTTSANIDLIQTLLSGRLIGGMTVIASIEALDGGPIASGNFVGTIPTPPILLEKASGDGQSGMVNTLLEQPLVVRFTRFGQPLQTVFALNWSVTAPSAATGYLVEASAAPVGPGKRAVGFRLGDKEGEYLIQGTCSHVCGEGRQGDSVTFTARAIKELKLDVDAGNHQTGRIGKTLPQMLVVRVTDADGQAVSGEAIAFRLSPESVEAGASLSVTSTGTDGEGRAKTSFTLGNISGESYTVIATCEECAPQSVTFTENAARVNIELTAQETELWPAKTSGGPQETSVTVEATDGLEGEYGPLSGYGIKLEVEPIASTGHQHGDADRSVGLLTSGCMIQSGICELTYAASEVSGREKVRAQAIEEPEVEGEIEIASRVPGLIPFVLLPFPEEEQHWEFLSANQLPNPDMHMGRQYIDGGIRSRLFRVGTRYLAKGLSVLFMADASLAEGGLFDVLGGWGTPYHHHREGFSVDIGALGLRSGTTGPGELVFVDEGELLAILSKEDTFAAAIPGNIIGEPSAYHIEFVPLH